MVCLCLVLLGIEPSQVELDGVHLLLLWIYSSPVHLIILTLLVGDDLEGHPMDMGDVLDV